MQLSDQNLCLLLLFCYALKVLVGMAAACLHLHHTCGIMHGDLYAHNILTPDEFSGSTQALLTDFGAASFAPADKQAALLERLEVRAFGCLMEDLLQRVPREDLRSSSAADSYHALEQLCGDCKYTTVELRPDFASISTRLSLVASRIEYHHQN